MEFAEFILKFFGDISLSSNKLDKFIELDSIKVENYEKKNPSRILAINKTVKTQEEAQKPLDMSVYLYEYSKNWWEKKHGHFNEELYKRFLNTRAPELH